MNGLNTKRVSVLAGLGIVAPDLPGHGRSSAPDVEYTARYFTDVVEKFLDALDLRRVLLVGLIGASIGLALAARRNPRLASVIASNPYYYGRRGGIRRSSLLANVVFTAMTWPVIGSVRVPALWALPAGLGDVLVGATSLWVARGLEHPGGKTS